MNSPKVSIIIATYKGADVLLEAVQSILNQTYQNFEIVIVDDASPDHTAELFDPLPDPRVQYLRQEKNAGARASRRVGIRASTGDIIAFLDQDDLYHPEKLQAHVTHFKKHPEVGMTYNARYSISDQMGNIRDIYRPPHQITLRDAIVGFPLSPSDMVLRRQWAKPEYMEGPWGNSGGEIVLLGRLILDGCKLGYVDRALNYRRFESGRVFGNLTGNCASELKCIEIITTDPRCPADVAQMGGFASILIYAYWGSRAFSQGNPELGRELYLKALNLHPAILEGAPSPMMGYLLNFAIEDESKDHVEILDKVLSNLPSELTSLIHEREWAVACGYLMKASRAVMWGRTEYGSTQADALKQIKVEFNDSHLERLAAFLVEYDAEFGINATRQVIGKWQSHFGNTIGTNNMKRLEEKYLMGRAFRNFQNGYFLRVPGNVFRALLQNPRQLRSPGVIGMLWRSFKGVAKWILRRQPVRIGAVA